MRQTFMRKQFVFLRERKRKRVPESRTTLELKFYCVCTKRYCTVAIKNAVNIYSQKHPPKKNSVQKRDLSRTKANLDGLFVSTSANKMSNFQATLRSVMYYCRCQEPFY